jgi:hypothetical protein
MFTPVVTEISKPPADAGKDTFIVDLAKPRTNPASVTTRGASR